MFESTEFSFRTIIERVQMMAFLNKGLEIRVKDERPGHQAEEQARAGRRDGGEHRGERERYAEPALQPGQQESGDTSQ